MIRNSIVLLAMLTLNCYSLFAQSAKENYEKGRFLLSYDTDKAIVLLKKAAFDGNRRAWESLGEAYYSEGEIALAKEAYLQAAEKGSPLGEYATAMLAFEEKNYEKAYRYAYKSYLNGHPEGTKLLADLYYSGVHVKKDVSAALTYYKRAIDKGSLTTMVNLGIAYYFGQEGISKDHHLAAKYFNLYLEKTAPDSPIYALGKVFYEGTKVRQDIPKAAKLFYSSLKGLELESKMKRSRGGKKEINDYIEFRRKEEFQSIAKDIDYTPEAKFYLGLLGDSNSKKLMEESAREEYEPAMFNEAMLKYEMGGSIEKAISSLKVVADKGYVPAKQELASLRQQKNMKFPNDSGWRELGKTEDNGTYYVNTNWFYNESPFITAQVLLKENTIRTYKGQRYNQQMYLMTVYYDDQGAKSYFIPEEYYYLNGKLIREVRITKDFNPFIKGFIKHSIGNFMVDNRGGNILRHFTPEDFSNNN